jgi:hypothetical protein
MIIEKRARETLTAVELDPGDELHFTLASGQCRKIRLEKTYAKIIHTTLQEPKVEEPASITNFRFFCTLTIDGHSISIAREVASQRSFYEPREFLGLRIWFDACDDIFEFLTETHGPCRPRKKARFAIQDASLRICPVLLHPWCPLPPNTLRIEDAYRGEDVWLGAYNGASAHGGLDINHPAGAPLWSPIPIDDHEMFNSLAKGDNNNRWRGFHKWPDGSTWILQSHHLVRLLVPEHQAFPPGTKYADAAGVLTGDHEHSHFVFKIIEPGRQMGEEIAIDPWILFWQMYRDRKETTAR